METQKKRKVTQEKVFQAIWLALGLACLIGVFCGAKHHIATTVICGIMAMAFRSEDPDRKRK